MVILDAKQYKSMDKFAFIIDEWDNIKAKGYEEINGNINCPFLFTNEMKCLCGKTFTFHVAKVSDDINYILFHSAESQYNFSMAMFKTHSPSALKLLNL